MMAKPQSVHNSHSKCGKICALHRALHRVLEFDGFRSIDPESTLHDGHVDSLDGLSERDFVDFALIGEKCQIEAPS